MKSSDSLVHRHPSNIPVLTCAFLAALNAGGVIYSFGLYGGELKKNLNLTQSQLDTISSANFCAGLLGWIPGLIVDRAGVRVSVCAGGLVEAFFMTGYWAVAKQILVVPQPYILNTLCLLGVLIFVSNGLIVGSVFKIFVAACASSTKGSIVGAAKGYIGLGSGVYACLFQALKSPGITDLDFIPMAATMLISLVVLPSLILLPNQETMHELFATRLDRTTKWHLTVLYVGLIALASIVIGTTLDSLRGDDYSDSDDTYDSTTETVKEHPHYGKIMLILSAWLLPILALLCLPTKPLDDYEDVDDVGWESLVMPHSSAALAYGAEISDSVRIKGIRGMLGFRVAGLTERPNLTLSGMLLTWPAWIFAWIVVIHVGAGTMVTNNIGQMVESLKLPQQTTITASLALFSVAQAASRVATGAISDWALSWNIRTQFTRGWNHWKTQGIPRPAFLILATLASTLAHLFMAITTKRNWFLLGVMFSGASFGMLWPLMVLIVGEVFGTANMGANYMFYDGFPSSLGTLLLSKFLTQEVYEKNIGSNSPHDNAYQDGRTCYGRSCFYESHIIVAALSFTCIIASYFLYRSTRHIYATKI